MSKLGIAETSAEPTSTFRLRWPTDYPLVTQPFGENPQVYRRWGLAGHPGVNIRAPAGSPIYAAAAGEVALVENYEGDAAQQPWGVWIEIAHAEGYSTFYAHLSKAHVSPGQSVQAGEMIGSAGMTGSTTEAQLHFAVRQTTAGGAERETFVDPLLFLELPAPLSALDYPWPPGFCYVGVHGRTDGPMQPADYPPVTTARLEAVKLLSSARPENVDELRALYAPMFVLVRLFASFNGRNYPAAQFAQDIQHDLSQFYQRGIRYFEIHNEPNLVWEGWTTSWQNGQEFGNWFITVRNILKPIFPQALFGFPGLSPGGSIPGIRTDALQFLSGADAACLAADWIGIHCYWQSEAEMNSEAGGRGYFEYRRRYPNKLFFITEFSNVAAGVSKTIKGQQYVNYYRYIRGEPGLGAAFSYVLSASSGFGEETWRNEDGTVTPIPGLVGAREDIVIPPPPPP